MRTAGKITVSAIALLTLTGGALLLAGRTLQLQSKALHVATKQMTVADPRMLSALADASARLDVYETAFAAPLATPAGA